MDEQKTTGAELNERQKNEVELDEQQKREAITFVRELMDKIAKYMTTAFQLAHLEYQVDKETFWRNLFIEEGTGWYDRKTKCTANDKPILKKGEAGRYPDSCPEDPYKKLDFQACCKYLRFGGTRIVSYNEKGAPRYAVDSYQVFKFWGIQYSNKNDNQWASGGAEKLYQDILSDCMNIRNAYMHMDEKYFAAITLDQINRNIRRFEDLTNPFARKHRGWEQKAGFECPVSKFWEKKEREFKERFGVPPVSLTEIGREIFLSDAEKLTDEQKNALTEAARYMKLACVDGKVYGEPDVGVIKEKLCLAPPMASLLGRAAAATPEEAAERAEKVRRPEMPEEEEGLRTPLEAPLWAPAKPTAAAALKRAGGMMEPKESILTALLDTFTLLVDESLFLAAEGREFLTEHLAPMLMKRHERLLVDESVVAALFKQFRNSVPYTDLELAEFEPAEAEEQQALRKELHKNVKTAIKTLRFMRQRKCLEIVFSPTESPYSFENIYRVVEKYPESRFLVLTQDLQLAGELAEVYGRNAVAAKPSLDGEVVLFRATRPTFQAMLEQRPGGEDRDGRLMDTAEASPKNEAPRPVPPKEPEPERPHPPKKILSVREAVRTGSCVTAEWPDGNRLEVRLGKSIGAGGEGTIYRTSLQNGAVAKIYFPKQLTESRRDKLRRMVGTDPGIPGLCWPQAMLYTAGGDWVGYLMPEAQGKELALTVFHPGKNNCTITALGWTRKSLALIAANIAEAFAKMHERQILMGDINPRNFLVTQDCGVYLVDCDSYQFDGFPCPVGTPLYTPPEVHRRMKERGTEDYGYIRTVDNERYSLAVLLFEILMLGKPPYESRNTNNEDVVQAIINGQFPYPYRTGKEDREEEYRGTLQAPVGRWRQIWSHFTYQVKTDFYNTFTGKKRLTAVDWERSMRQYIRVIEAGNSSDELVPSGYKVLTDRDGEEGTTRMVDLVCSQCQEHFNMGEDVYNLRKRYGEPILCPSHWEMRKNFRRRKRMVVCGCCGEEFESTVAEWMEAEQSGKPMVCPKCVNVTVRCSACGGIYSISRNRMEELKARGERLLCPECFNVEFPRVTCEGENCQEVFRTSRAKLERLQRFNRPVLCSKCLRQMLQARENPEENKE